MTYKELRDRQQAEHNNFPYMFAFSDKQFAEGMRDKFGLTPEDTDKIYSIGAGGYILKTDAPRLREMRDRHYNELQEALKDPAFFEEALYYELCNHEYCYTGDSDDALTALGLTAEDITADPARLEAYRSATRRALEDCE